MSTRRIFGENSDSRLSNVLDGSSNTVAVAETVYDVYNGRTAGWGLRLGDARYRLRHVPHQSVGRIRGPRPAQRGRLASWGHPGSLHPGGVHVVLADGSTRFVLETVDDVIKERMAAMADGEPVELP